MWEWRGEKEDLEWGDDNRSMKDGELQCSVFHVSVSFLQACVPPALLGVVVWRRAGERGWMGAWQCHMATIPSEVAPENSPHTVIVTGTTTTLLVMIMDSTHTSL